MTYITLRWTHTPAIQGQPGSFFPFSCQRNAATYGTTVVLGETAPQLNVPEKKGEESGSTFLMYGFFMIFQND